MNDIICPKCKNRDVDRVPRPSFMKKWMPWLPYRKFFCYSCSRSMYLRVYKKQDTDKDQKRTFNYFDRKKD